MARLAGRVIEGVHPVRGLPAAEDVSYRVIDDEAFLVELKALFHEEYPEAYVAAEEPTRVSVSLAPTMISKNSSFRSTTARCWPTTSRGRRPSR